MATGAEITTQIVSRLQGISALSTRVYRGQYKHTREGDVTFPFAVVRCESESGELHGGHYQAERSYTIEALLEDGSTVETDMETMARDIRRALAPCDGWTLLAPPAGIEVEMSYPEDGSDYARVVVSFTVNYHDPVS